MKVEAKQPAEIVKIKKIILADDSPSMHFYYETLMKRLNVVLISAFDGNEAIQLLKEHGDTDLILMDMRMPGMDGPTALKDLRKFNKEVRVVGQSSFTTCEQIKDFIEMGFDDYLIKPINEEKMALLLEQLSTV